MHTMLCPHTSPTSIGHARPEAFEADRRTVFGVFDHVAPGDDHDARPETLCVGESR